MKRHICLWFLFLIGFYLNPMECNAQNKPSVQIEGKSISTEEDLVISVSAEQPANATEGIPYKFPEINFFKKVGVSRGKASTLVNNQMVSEVIYSQHYRAVNPGIFQIPELEVLLFQQSVKTEPFTVTVVKGIEVPKVEDFFPKSELTKDILPSKNKLFLLVSSNEYQPYVGQGFTLKFSLFIPEDNEQELEFDRNDIQIPLQLQKLKPSNCWQENFDLQTEKIISTTFQGKKYKEYRFYQATFYALDNQIIKIPSLKLRLSKIQKKGNEVQKTPIEFSSIPFQIKPKNLPKGISPTKIPVGRYELREEIDRNSIRTGQKIEYKSSFVGDGNTFAIEDPEVESDYFLRFTTLNKEEVIFPSGDKMFGNNSQKIQIIPRQPGKFELKKYFYWVYFNTDKGKLDTLYSKLTLDVKGGPSDAHLNTAEESSEIYQGIENLSSLENTWNTWENWRKITQIILFILVIIFGYLLTSRTKK